MRWIFLTLFLANIALFAWQQYRPATAGGQTQQVTPVPEAPNKILLLDEQGRRKKLDRVVKTPVVGSSNDEAGMCLAVGPFEDLFSGQDVVDQLTALDIDADLRALDRPTGERDYRVMIPPASSLENAFRKLRELKSRNIDSYVITQGPDVLAISLGVFSSREAAEEAREQRKKEGYETVISAIPRLHRQYWIYAADGGDLQIPVDLWQRLRAEHPDIERRRITCSG